MLCAIAITIALIWTGAVIALLLASLNTRFPDLWDDIVWASFMIVMLPIVFVGSTFERRR